jgi:hypothetical protein
MPNVTMVISPQELDYLRRAVTRDLRDFDESSMDHDMEEYAIVEAAHASAMLKVLQRIEQEQVFTH